MMLAARYERAGTIEVVEIEPEPPGPGEVQIEVAYTGICGTDLHVFHGAMDGRVPPHTVIGHEMSGYVRAAGHDVHDWTVGDLVTVMPLQWCGACPACLDGNTHICHRLVFVGLDAPGSLQQRWNVDAGLLVRVPQGMDPAHAALIEPSAVAVHDVDRAGLSGSDITLVIGAGPIGLLIASVARSRGATVLLAETDDGRRRLAQSLGFEVLDQAEEAMLDRLDVVTSSAGVDVAFEVSGSQAGLDLAVNVLATRGRLVLVGIHPPSRTIDLFRVFWRELNLHGARVYQRRDFEVAVELIANDLIPARALISHVIPIRDVAEAFAALDSRSGAMKILVDCRAR